MPKEKTLFYAGGFLYNPFRREVLLHLRDGKTSVNPNKWAFFGGMSEGEETPEACCVREWKEELGITVNPQRLIPVCDYLNTDHNTWRYVYMYPSDLLKNQMQLGEGAGFDWIPLENVFEYDLTDKTVHDLRLFLRQQE